MNTKFATYATSTAFSLTLSRIALIYLEMYVTGNRDLTENVNWPGWQPLERRGLIDCHRAGPGMPSNGTEVTEAGFLVFRLCQEAGLISKDARPMASLLARYAA